MSGFADAMSRFAQPLIDASDGSQEELERALKLSQLCWNLAILPQESREGFLSKMQQALSMDDEEFQDLKSGVVLPMIQRHQEMFPALHHPPGWSHHKVLQCVLVRPQPREHGW